MTPNGVLELIQEYQRTVTPERTGCPDRPIETLKAFLEELCDSVVVIGAAAFSDFLCRWYLEHHRSSSDTNALFDFLTEFLSWAARERGWRAASEALQSLPSHKDSVLRAISITQGLSDSLRTRGGPFGFTEFLTSFEQGGHSSYDVDEANDESEAMDGHFRILSMEGPLAEAEEIISERRVGPIVFPSEVAPLIRPGYILDLEIVKQADRWLIVDAGIALPPDSPVLL